MKKVSLTKTHRVALLLLSSLVAVNVQSAMLLEYKFDGDGTNTGTTGSANNLTITGTGTAPTYTGAASPFETGTSYNSSALVYNTAGQVAEAGGLTLASGSSFTISGWLDATASQGSGARILDKGGNASGGFTLQFSGPNLLLQLGNGTTLGGGTSSGYTFGTLNTWQWFAVTYNATTGDISYFTLNGSNQVTLLNTVASGITGYTNNGNTLRVLNGSGGARAFVGLADDLRLFNDVESIAQLQALAVVPEPSSAWLLGVSIFGLILLRKKLAIA